MTKRACEGADTRSTREGPEHFEECRECKTGVRWDLVNHPFFGFRAGCDRPTERPQAFPAAERERKISDARTEELKALVERLDHR